MIAPDLPNGLADGRRRIALIGDTHLAATVEEHDPIGRIGVTNFGIVGAELRRMRPDLVVHLGDIVRFDPDATADHEYARRQLDATGLPLLAIAGNHDVGGKRTGIVTGSGTEGEVTPERLARFRRIWGPDRWSVDVGGVRFLGINSQLVGTGLAEESAQYDWIRARTTGCERPIVVLLHKPLPGWRDPGWQPDPGTEWAFMASELHRPIESAFAAEPTLIVSAHVHLYRYATQGPVPMVWVPSTCWVPNPEITVPPAADPSDRHEAGIVVLTVENGTVHVEFVAPAGIQTSHYLPPLATS